MGMVVVVYLLTDFTECGAGRLSSARRALTARAAAAPSSACTIIPFYSLFRPPISEFTLSNDSGGSELSGGRLRSHRYHDAIDACVDTA